MSTTNDTTNATVDPTSFYTANSTPTYPADVVWVLCSTGMIFYMQMGFMFLEAGSIRRKNLSNSMTKAFVGICMSAITFYLIGYGIGFGANN
jgi:ammonium transporter, Amt family